jgi:raffinose/stachyose/melibiose transport system substrate-binding protein
MKKFMAILLAVALSAATLTACTTIGGTSSTADVSSIKEVSSQPVYNATITLYSTFTPGDWSTALFTLAAEDSGVKYVNIAEAGDVSYREAVTYAFEKGGDPDVLYYWMGDEAEPFVTDNKFVSIEEIKQDYPDFIDDHDIKLFDATDAKAVDGKHYFVPSHGYSEALFVNKKVLAAAGVSVPDKNTTYEQWVEDLKKIKKAGYTPLVGLVI